MLNIIYEIIIHEVSVTNCEIEKGKRNELIIGLQNKRLIC